MSVITAGNSSYQGFLRKFYSSNRAASRASSRSTIGNAELLSADSKALKKISKNLQELTYDKDSGEEIYQNIKAFVETYNNLLENSDKIVDAPLERTMKKLKNFIKDNTETLEEIGIKVSSSRKLTLDKEDLLKCTPKKIGKVFSDSNDISSNLVSLTTKLERMAKPLMQTESRIRNQRQQQNASIADLPVTTSTMSSTKIDFMA
ncbi:MAG: hypothetical protein HFH62_04765 [Lachnospiraceae bacterium]|nr:hypothetical protein [Lachnospiraceae bacterium]